MPQKSGETPDRDDAERLGMLGRMLLGDVNLAAIDADPATKTTRAGRERAPAERRQAAMLMAAGAALCECIARAEAVDPSRDWAAIFLKEQGNGETSISTAAGDSGNGEAVGP